MEWWEVVLFLLYSIVAGSAFFGLVCWLASLFEREPQTTSLGASTLPFTSRNPEVPLVIEEQPKLLDPKLMAEVKNNFRISSEPWTGELIPFHTRVWDAEQYELYELPTNQRNDLKQVYDMIGQANQIIWFSTEFNCRDQNIDETYRRIRTIIAERLHRIKKNVEYSLLIAAQGKLESPEMV